MADTCIACGCPLIWSLSPAGARSPIERYPASDGNVLLLGAEPLGVLAIVLSKDALELARDRGMALRRNHFAQCPFKDDFRRKGPDKE